jgi:peptidoglycan/xylan/chitin deacetylase (PgdA/CDA1 family)
METHAELVLSFHGIGTPPAWIPVDEVQYWISAAAFADFAAKAGAWTRKTGMPILATFDDGNRSDLLVAAPLLQSHAIPGAFFVCTGRFGRADWLDEKDLAELAAQGFEIGSHGIEHVPWTSLSAQQLVNEVGGSRATLARILGRDIEATAIPFGAYNRRVLAAIRDAGYRRAYNSDPGISARDAQFIRRWTITQGMAFDFDDMVLRSGSMRHRLTQGAKGLIKAWR